MQIKTPPMRYLNKVFLKGRLGKNPEIRQLPSGDPVCNFSLATRIGRHVEWHKIVAYDDIAEYVNAAYGTGDFVYVEGEIRTREFQTSEDKLNNRKPRKVLEIVVIETHLLKKRGNSDSVDDDIPSVGPADESIARDNVGDGVEQSVVISYL